MRGFVPVVLIAGLVVAFARAPAFADDRPRVAVLGLEVTSAVDVRTTELAHDLTEGMRARARVGSGPYAYAASSERELIDEKLIKGCDDERPACMAEIGKELDANVIVYGKLEKEDKVVKMSLQLLDVDKKTKINRITVNVPLGASKEEVKTVARRAYEELAGASASGGAGTIEVQANVLTGTVYVDDSSSEIIENGQATLTLPEGRYRIAVESPGKQRKEITVTVKPEQVITQEFELADASKVVGGTSGIGFWKPAFIATTAIGGGIGLYSLYLYISWKGDVDDIRASRTTPGFITASDCDGSGVKAGVDDKNGILTNLCSTRSRQITTAIVATAFVVPFAITGYMAFIRKSNKENSGGVAITPMVTRTTAGASLQFDF
ncbi:MAG: hypothetical protein AB7T06_19510 [Kofleriaceae bacterium]